jgi:glycosyltransferase involved in cell wall biosynthesis
MAALVDHTEIGSAELISVIIPCYNQAHFLGEAIESVLAQTYPHFKILVVDDGSTDNTADVAASYPYVRYIRQDNQGLSTARNTGLRHSTGQCLVFLDADDRLLADALERGLACLKANPECAFTVGRYQVIAADSSFLAEGPQHRMVGDHYATLLQRKCIPVPAAVMYQRWAFDHVGGFDTTQSPTADCELYLRISRQFPTVFHDTVVMEYRQHDANMTRNAALMLSSWQATLRAQLPYVKGNRRYEEAYRLGFRDAQQVWGRQLSKQVRAALERRAWLSALRSSLVLFRYAPSILVETLKYVPRHIPHWLGAARHNQQKNRRSHVEP